MDGAPSHRRSGLADVCTRSCSCPPPSWCGIFWRWQVRPSNGGAGALKAGTVVHVMQRGRGGDSSATAAAWLPRVCFTSIHMCLNSGLRFWTNADMPCTARGKGTAVGRARERGISAAAAGSTAVATSHRCPPHAHALLAATNQAAPTSFWSDSAKQLQNSRFSKRSPSFRPCSCFQTRGEVAEPHASEALAGRKAFGAASSAPACRIEWAWRQAHAEGRLQGNHSVAAAPFVLSMASAAGAWCSTGCRGGGQARQVDARSGQDGNPACLRHQHTLLSLGHHRGAHLCYAARQLHKDETTHTRHVQHRGDAQGTCIEGCRPGMQAGAAGAARPAVRWLCGGTLPRPPSTRPPRFLHQANGTLPLTLRASSSSSAAGSTREASPIRTASVALTRAPAGARGGGEKGRSGMGFGAVMGLPAQKGGTAGHGDGSRSPSSTNSMARLLLFTPIFESNTLKR